MRKFILSNGSTKYLKISHENEQKKLKEFDAVGGKKKEL
jgi:hypothetical protein